MTANEFAVLHCIEAIGATQGLIPRGTTVKRVKEVLYDEGFGEIESVDITNALMALRRRRLVCSRPGPESALWMCTLYGRNVVSA